MDEVVLRIEGEGTFGISQSADLITGPVAESAPVLVSGGIRGLGEFLFSFPHQEGMAERQEALPNDTGFCFVVTFNILFPKRSLVVKGADGQWQILP